MTAADSDREAVDDVQWVGPGEAVVGSRVQGIITVVPVSVLGHVGMGRR